ncbi:MAG: flagellar hook assembly protein FlgD [Pararhodobacter sp.]|nr:flagellar hook assembly protein FlgD [Pararhodobacter sp.]
MQITSNFGTPPQAMGTGSTQQSDYQTFLNMLTVQMRHQDPLNPMNSTEFAVQLATFSGVEQQSYTNQLLAAMLNQTGLADLGAWVGMEARIFGGVWYDGEPIELTPDPTLGADEVALIVRDKDGNIVDRRDLDPESLNYEWDGLDEDGNPLPEGTYSFEIESKKDGEVMDTQPVAAYVPILEARYEGGMTMLVLPGNLWVDSSSVTGLRRPVGDR